MKRSSFSLCALSAILLLALAAPASAAEFQEPREIFLPLGPCDAIPLSCAQLSTGNDNWTGTSSADCVKGLAGDDLLSGEGGKDHLFGNADDDALHGGNGDDCLRGGNGNDALWGDAGDDEVLGGNGDDLINCGGDSGDMADGGAHVLGDSCSQCATAINCNP